ncbi:MAG: S46 family peptidase [Bacteroidetes bacterium]|nr:S46 family peptidase [Bacteroidota bacterium]
MNKGICYSGFSCGQAILRKAGQMMLLLFSLLIPVHSYSVNPPDEGMWLPLLIERLNYTDMQKMGLHLTADELYSINHSSLKDAIVGLSGGAASDGFFCTAEVVSDEGLLFTNHHCGFEAIDNHSTPEHDYLNNGFWAMLKKDELKNESLNASFLVRMENVTDSIIPFLPDTLKEKDRTAKIKEIINRLKKRVSGKDKYDVTIKPFYGGNEYYLFVFQTYKDVRLVGAPPASIGKFGGDTDNWMWPRQTGDFSIFRIYADSAGNPADYSTKNIPLHPKYHLPISLKGFKKNDFTMTWGYPASTSRYLTSFGIRFNIAILYPTVVRIFGKELEIMKERMDADKKVDLAYASNYAQIANTWKNFIGQEKMLVKNNVVEKKKELEESFIAWYSKDAALLKKYGSILGNLKAGYEKMEKSAIPFLYANLAGSNSDIVKFANQFGSLKSALEKKSKGAISESVKQLRDAAKSHYKEKDFAISKKTFAELLKLYQKTVRKDQLPSIFQLIHKKFKGNIDAFADAVYSESVFATPELTKRFLDKPKLSVFKKDLAWKCAESFSETFGKYSGSYAESRTSNSVNNRLFIAGLRQMSPNKIFYPDANSTMRMSYGSILDYQAADAVHYDYFTTLKGVMEKEDSTNEEFIVAKRLKELYKAKDYGPYGEDGKMIVCFLTTNDITGGNSGSPVINGNGQLVGLAFDGNWEAMSGDISFEPYLQRTICVDIRYVLFIIDKYAGATNLIKELTLVK